MKFSKAQTASPLHSKGAEAPAGAWELRLLSPGRFVASEFIFKPVSILATFIFKKPIVFFSIF